MERSEPYRDDEPRNRARVDGPLRLIELSRGEPWPERQYCEIVLVLVLDCRAPGLALAAGGGDLLAVGETTLLPLGNGLIASAQGRVLAARLEAVTAPPPRSASPTG